MILVLVELFLDLGYHFLLMTLEAAYYFELWDIAPAGEPFFKHPSLLQPVIYQKQRCMFKIVIAEEERRGNPIVKWVQGNAVAKIFNYDSRAILMERAIGEKSG